MTHRHIFAMAALGLVLVTGCSKKGAEGSTPPETTPPASEIADRPAMTSAECQEKGGTIVGDIGDGAIHRPDYRCENGQPPIASIKSNEGEPVAIEGSVCCPAAGS